MVIVLIDQRHVDAGPGQTLCRVEAAKAAADNDNPLMRWSLRPALVSRQSACLPRQPRGRDNHDRDDDDPQQDDRPDDPVLRSINPARRAGCIGGNRR